MRRRIMLQEGQRYIQKFKTSPRKQVWEVASLYTDTTHVQHARLVNVSNLTETKTLSCFALDGEYDFSLTNT